MIENRIDETRTAKAKKFGEFEDPRSYYSIAGHIYLAGKDRTRRWREVIEHARYICAICHKHIFPAWGAEMDHIKGARKHQRCDCFFTGLADGTYHTNLQCVHGMFSTEGCHRKKHNRETKFKGVTVQLKDET